MSKGPKEEEKKEDQVEQTTEIDSDDNYLDNRLSSSGTVSRMEIPDSGPTINITSPSDD